LPAALALSIPIGIAEVICAGACPNPGRVLSATIL
jgi:hypothetical protein